MKTTEKHSQLNEFRLGCAQHSGSPYLEWTINPNKDIAGEGPLPGSNFLFWETRDQPQSGSPLSRFLGHEEEGPWERG